MDKVNEMYKMSIKDGKVIAKILGISKEFEEWDTYKLTSEKIEVFLLEKWRDTRFFGYLKLLKIVFDANDYPNEDNTKIEQQSEQHIEDALIRKLFGGTSF